jgi:(p)ppGpp synthase/HD superfamily hydrolase
MSPYAQTNVQLFDQLQCEGYSNSELTLINNAYDLACRLCTGLYRPSGKTFIDHLVGTASILASLHTSAELIAAALLHAVYEHGDFGKGSKGISVEKRVQVKQVVGDQVEEYVTRYTALRWSSKTISPIQDNFRQLESIDREALLLRLVNELEDLSDLGVLYCFGAEPARRNYLRWMPAMVEMAGVLGFPTLAANLTRIAGEIASAEIPAELCRRQPGVMLLAPQSSCRRLRIAFRQELTRGLRRVRSLLRV